MQWALAAVATLALLSLITFEVTMAARITPGVRVFGTHVGGMTESQAAMELRPQVEAMLSRPIQLRYQERTWQRNGRELGIRADPEELAKLAYQVGRDGNPAVRLWDQLGALITTRPISLDSAVDRELASQQVTTIAQEIDREPRDAQIGVRVDGTLDYVSGQSRRALDRRATLATVVGALSEGRVEIDLVVDEQAPTIPNDLVQNARDKLEALFGDGEHEPPALTFGQQSWPLDRGDLARLVTIEAPAAENKAATVKANEQQVGTLVRRLATEINQDKQEARFTYNGGNLQVLRPSRQGRVIDESATAAAISGMINEGTRRVEVPVKVAEPAVSSDNPQALGITDRIDSGSTSFGGSVSEKVWNIKLAAERLNGVVVPPGGTFSFNKELGPTTLESGFRWGFGITTGEQGVQTVPSVGGGICQVATTLFQPVFWSGYPLEERYWHLYWIPAYASRGVVGLDVTVDEDSNLDFKWINPTNDHILIQSSTDADRIYFSLYGKKPNWKVTVDDPVITNRVPPDLEPATEEDKTLAWGRRIQVQTAREGFNVQIIRRVLPDGGEPRLLNLRSKYEPARTLTLVGIAGRPPGVTSEEERNTDPSSTENRPSVSSTPTGDRTANTPVALPSNTNTAPTTVPAPTTARPATAAVPVQPTVAAPANPVPAPTQPPAAAPSGAVTAITQGAPLLPAPAVRTTAEPARVTPSP